MNDHGREPGTGNRRACERVRARLVELEDGALSPIEAARDGGHLEACSGCAAESLELARTIALLRRASQPREGELTTLVEVVLSRLPTGAPPRRRIGVARVWPSLVAAAALLLFFGLGALGFVPRGLEEFQWRLPRVLTNPEFWTPDWSPWVGVSDAGERDR